LFGRICNPARIGKVGSVIHLWPQEGITDADLPLGAGLQIRTNVLLQFLEIFSCSPKEFSDSEPNVLLEVGHQAVAGTTRGCGAFVAVSEFVR
jgi:hypothetical protein